MIKVLVTEGLPITASTFFSFAKCFPLFCKLVVFELGETPKLQTIFMGHTCHISTWYSLKGQLNIKNLKQQQFIKDKRGIISFLKIQKINVSVSNTTLFKMAIHRDFQIIFPDAFELWCWRRLLRVPWTARRSNQISEGDQLWDFFGGNDAKLKLLYFGYLM